MVANIEVGAQRADFDRCRHGPGLRKPTCISGTAASLMELMSERRGNHPGGHHTTAGVGQDGRFITTLAQERPAELCTTLVEIHLKAIIALPGATIRKITWQDEL